MSIVIHELQRSCTVTSDHGLLRILLLVAIISSPVLNSIILSKLLHEIQLVSSEQ